MSQGPFQGFEPQGAGPQGFSTPPVNSYPAPAPRGGGSTWTIVLIIVGVVMLVGVLMCGVLAALLFPAVSAARESARRMQDSNSLKQVALAFHNYNDALRKMPAPFAVNSQNEKVWSWSVSLLPFCEQTAIFNQVNFKDMRPWDSPSNAMLQGAAPPYLRSLRSDLPEDTWDGNVFIISAPTKKESGNPFFVDGTYTSFRDCTDGTSNTILAIMLAKHSAPWASPATLTADEAFQLIQNEDKFFQVAMCDGSVIVLPVTIDMATFGAMVTRDGGEVVTIPSYP